MKIEKIHIQNFLSHSDIILDLCGLNVFVVIGKNGAEVRIIGEY